jgi:hypothetical protein
MDAAVTAQPLKYSVIRLRPHAETEEFANVGIVLVAPRTGYFDFRLETTNIERITAFFDKISPELVAAFLQDCKSDLDRLRDLANQDRVPNALAVQADADALFSALTKDREGVIRFSDIRYALDASPSEKLERLFRTYVPGATVLEHFGPASEKG